jgi:hypothetical protein
LRIVLRRIFGPNKVEVTGEWRNLHINELSDLYCSPTIVQAIKSRKMRWAGHVARMGRIEACNGFWWGNVRERDHWGDPRHIWEDNIKMDLQEMMWRIWTGSSWLRIEKVGGFL